MNGLLLIVLVSAVLALVARSFWRQLVEATVLVLLFVFFVGVLTLIAEGPLAFYGS
jgi:uncharacterized membrane protein YoaK (UPF0700 family)